MCTKFWITQFWDFNVLSTAQGHLGTSPLLYTSAQTTRCSALAFVKWLDQHRIGLEVTVHAGHAPKAEGSRTDGPHPTKAKYIAAMIPCRQVPTSGVPVLCKVSPAATHCRWHGIHPWSKLSTVFCMKQLDPCMKEHSNKRPALPWRPLVPNLLSL